ncbi:hypothetical protein RB619_07885 [Flavobacterium sp. LHD-80]|uniref:hypothetical protein n=1 Tax=Flavobacterium sp. LHD-80 TaxID=3071411 RepID=UPI0027E024AE|nr:hypothetical protein [Flavobacterium sp. LHD-80]MDQ6470560.1 hypothetical protein [Flavobacterium sp. LHD-80]
MKNLLMVAVLILGTSAMVNAQTAPTQAASAKEVKATKHHNHKSGKKEKTEKSDAPKPEAANVKK